MECRKTMQNLYKKSKLILIMKKFIIITVVGILFAIFFWPDTVIRIKSVENGNTLVLSNGATVKLLGVMPTQEARTELYGLRNLPVHLVADGNAYYDMEKLTTNSFVNAYLLLPNNGYECVNATLLKKGLTTFVENCVDSLDSFRKYAEQASREGAPFTPEPAPEIVYSEDEIHLDPYTPSAERKHSAWYNDGNMNLEMLEEACDFNLPYTKKFANELAARASGNFNPRQICEIFNYCYRKWSYVNDPADSEYVAKASETIYNSLTGDCDDFAILMASCILAVGGRPCINTGHNQGGGHAFTEVDISLFNEIDVLNTIREFYPAANISFLNYRVDGQYKWLNLDWQADYPGGEYYNCSLRRDTYPYIDGSWRWVRLH